MCFAATCMAQCDPHQANQLNTSLLLNICHRLQRLVDEAPSASLLDLMRLTLQPSLIQQLNPFLTEVRPIAALCFCQCWRQLYLAACMPDHIFDRAFDSVLTADFAPSPLQPPRCLLRAICAASTQRDCTRCRHLSYPFHSQALVAPHFCTGFVPAPSTSCAALAAAVCAGGPGGTAVRTRSSGA